MNANVNIHRSLGDWVDTFEGRLFAGQVTSVEEYFPSLEHPEFEAITAEILRVALEYHWRKVNQNYFADLRLEIPWILRHPNILGPVAFEDYRLRLDAGLSASTDSYRSLGIETRVWQSWLLEAEDPNETLVNRSLSSTQFGINDLASHDITVTKILGSNNIQGASVRPPITNDTSRRMTATVRLPIPGDRLGDFELIEQLGIGAFSRVFIARLTSLASPQLC